MAKEFPEYCSHGLDDEAVLNVFVNLVLNPSQRQCFVEFARYYDLTLFLTNNQRTLVSRKRFQRH